MNEKIDIDAGKTKNQLAVIRKAVFENLMEGFVPFPINRKACAEWAKGLDIPRNGNVILYTSYMYQLASLFRQYEGIVARVGRLAGVKPLSGIGRLIVRPDRAEMDRAGKILSGISSLLKEAGTDFSYLYDEEPYSGAILLELGMLQEFRSYGKKLSGFLESRGIRTVITVDPHTLNALSRLREMSLLGAEVKSYLEIIKLSPSNGRGNAYVLHDSCLYSRYLGMGGIIRKCLGDAGVELKEDEIVTGLRTSMCCGAPVGAVNRALSDRIAGMRVRSLKTVSENILVACPLCYQNLSKHSDRVADIMEVIA